MRPVYVIYRGQYRMKVPKIPLVSKTETPKPLKENPPLNNQRERLIRIKEVSLLTGLPRPSIYEQMNKGLFPKSIKLTQISVAWVESEVIAWVNQRISASRLEEV